MAFSNLHVPHSILSFSLASCGAAAALMACADEGPESVYSPASGGTPSASGGAPSASGGTPSASGGTPMSSGGGTGTVDDGLVPSAYIVVDQFGYLENSEKIAVIRSPEEGFDAAESYTPGETLQVIDTASGQSVLDVAPVPWSEGQVHTQSGDVAWHVDFSTVVTPGTYLLVDPTTGARSDEFVIGPTVYKDVFAHAFRTFFYQRASFAKEAPYAEPGWVDAASHIGEDQDQAARLYMALDDETTARDLSGGWYDAGDYNRYTAWSADYVMVMLRMYAERPEVFGDDMNIPESGNGVPDILDEARFGLTQLEKTQSEMGGCISVLGTSPQYATASPPSALSAQSVYGPESTNATIRAGIAFAWAARVFAEMDPDYAAVMLDRAERAWAFAEKNPDLVFENTGKIAAGEQQASADEVELYKLALAVALTRAGASADYRTYFETHYANADIQLLSGYNAGWQVQFTEAYLDYATLPDADPTVQATIVDAFLTTIEAANNLGILESEPDPYLAHVDDYTWGSNAHKSRTGCLLHDLITYGLAPAREADARRASARFVHYLHGVNPLSLVYLTNMNNVGAANSVSTIYHSWFTDGSALWDETGVSTYGPPPGFLAGGPNPSYELDASCPGQAGCPDTPPSPPSGQPDQKSYLDFNDGWPVNSWAVSENSNGYQVYYLRLLSKFL